MEIFGEYVPAFFSQAETNEEKSELNFQNEDSIEQKELADQDLIVAEKLVNDSEESVDIQVKKHVTEKRFKLLRKLLKNTRNP